MGIIKREGEIIRTKIQFGYCLNSNSNIGTLEKEMHNVDFVILLILFNDRWKECGSFLNNFHLEREKNGYNKGLKIKRAKSCASNDGSLVPSLEFK